MARPKARGAPRPSLDPTCLFRVFLQLEGARTRARGRLCARVLPPPARPRAARCALSRRCADRADPAPGARRLAWHMS
jgi:hypothetical protein